MPKGKRKIDVNDFIMPHYPDIPRSFQINQTVKLQDFTGNIEGYWAGDKVACVVRVVVEPLSKSNETYLRQFKCLTPNASVSRLYIIPENELRRQNEQKGQATQTNQKRTKSK